MGSIIFLLRAINNAPLFCPRTIVTASDVLSNKVVSNQERSLRKRFLANMPSSKGDQATNETTHKFK
jgi:hypothetical protein